MVCLFFFFKQKTAYEMRISDWSSDVCSSDLGADRLTEDVGPASAPVGLFRQHDLSFRIRRLRFLARRLSETLEVEATADDAVIQKMHDAKIGRASWRERVCRYV